MYDPTRIAEFQMALPTLVFFQNHNDVSTFDFLYEHIDELFQLGYRNICTDGVPVNIPYTIKFIRNELRVYQAFFDNPDTTELERLIISAGIAANRKKIDFLTKISTIGMKHFGCSMNQEDLNKSRTDPNFVANTDPVYNANQIAENFYKLENSVSGGFIVIVGYTLGTMQLRLEQLDLVTANLAQVVSKLDSRVSRYYYMLVGKSIAYQDDIGKGLCDIGTRADHVQKHFPRELSIVDCSQQKNLELMSEIKQKVQRHLACTPPTDNTVLPDKSLQLAIALYKNFCEDKRQIATLKSSIAAFHVTINACSIRGKQFDYLKSVALMNLGNIGLFVNDYDHARQYYQRALEVREKKYGKEHKTTQDAESALKTCLQRQLDQPNPEIKKEYQFYQACYQ